ncbi:MAG: hypothetical protein H0W88_08770 [Parachlamydiaceae bacterium]|nr:hypothetical protein [Parachlamydiaceae bacterium]
MISQWLTWLNCFIIGTILCLLIGTGIIWIQRPDDIVCTNPVVKQSRLPKSAFALSPECYKKIGEPLLVLQSTPPSLQIPDLKQHLVYYGKNGRPDTQLTGILLHFSFAGSKNIASIAPGEKLYLLYDKKNSSSRYTFSPDNAVTSLWIEGTPVENEVQVKVLMKNDKGDIITEPEANAQLKLPEKEFTRYAGGSWEIGTFRVDGTLLARQRARWHGIDKFLERHGGEEYKNLIGKHRVDFGEGEDIYSIFASVGECFIWNAEAKQWKSVIPGKESFDYPLLVVKKIEERLMGLELWDVEGKGKVLLNLLKSTEPWMIQNPQTIQHMFKFVGSRTRTQCVFEINHERMLISPSDWLLLTNKGWKKLTTEEDIDSYVKRKSTGTLFVFGGLVRKDERQYMTGALYNPTRSDFQEIELPLIPAGIKKDKKDDKNKNLKNTQPSRDSRNYNDDDDDDDDDDYDDEDDDDEEDDEPTDHLLKNKGVGERVNAPVITPHK